MFYFELHVSTVYLKRRESLFCIIFVSVSVDDRAFNLPHAYFYCCSDECYQNIQQLRSIKKETEELMSDPAKEPFNSNCKLLTDGELRRQSSFDDLAAVAPILQMSTALIASGDSSRPPSPLSDHSALVATPIIPAKDALLSEYDLMLNEEVTFR